jgi:hypothetical protein
MNNLNSNSALAFESRQDECQSWHVFANGIRKGQSWNAGWFAVARRFFLYDGAKEFSPKWDDVDRIVDYATTLEATLVPEQEFSKRRMSRRAAALVSDDSAGQDAVTNLVKQLYDIRYGIVHGSKLSDKTKDWLIENCGQIELRVRQVLVAALQKLAAEEQARRTILAGLYDPTDEDRGAFGLQSFYQIKTDEVRKAIATKIARLAGV